MSRSIIKIFTDFPPDIQKKLIRKVCISLKKRKVHISYFERFGWSGAKILLIYFNNKPIGVPFLLKTAKSNKINKEFKAVSKSDSLVHDAQSLFAKKPFHYEDTGALLYAHVGTENQEHAATPLAFRDILYKENDDFKFKITHLEKIIDETYNKLKNAHNSCDLKYHEVTLHSHFKRYIHSIKAKKRIESILGQNKNEEEFIFIDTQIYNPLLLIENLPEKREVQIGFIHGDLHTDNIIINLTHTPFIIDFAWACENKSVLIDFVILENSIRFMDFPKETSFEEQKFVDQSLLNDSSYELIYNYYFSTPKSKYIYTRLAKMVERIRKNAKDLIGEEQFMEKYLLIQFILLFGLLSYNTYGQYKATRALGMIARELKNSGYLVS